MSFKYIDANNNQFIIFMLHIEVRGKEEPVHTFLNGHIETYSRWFYLNLYYLDYAVRILSTIRILTMTIAKA